MQHSIYSSEFIVEYYIDEDDGLLKRVSTYSIPFSRVEQGPGPG
jgi:hypothetical protein